MKKLVLLFIPILICLIYVCNACCKEEICVNRLDGKYICTVDKYTYENLYRYSELFIERRKTLQEIHIINDSTFTFDVTVGNLLLNDDTVNIIYNSSTKDSICFNNYNHVVYGIGQIRYIHGYFNKNKINFEVHIPTSPYSGVFYLYEGRKKSNY
ncbi:MAG: hypothetical protein WCP57_04280 [Bacteroidota bacterium]